MMPRKSSKRRTSKFWLATNTGLAWVAIFYALHTGQGATVIAALVGIIGNYGVYTAVGHMDLRETMRSLPPMSPDKYEGID